jgi:copper homeostasis protein
MASIKLEICAYNLQSALVAQSNGADRVELCTAPADGGTTPGAGTIIKARKLLNIPLFVMIRPRGGDFLYSENEFETMMLDIAFAKNAGADGVVLGALKQDGTVDTQRTARLVEKAHPLEVTFHRAFDLTNDPFKALEDVMMSGANRILTSGQNVNSLQGKKLISTLVNTAGEKISIMAGSGINDGNVMQLITETGVEEVHLSAKKYLPSMMKYRREDLPMGATESTEYEILSADGEMIRRISEMIKKC